MHALPGTHFSHLRRFACLVLVSIALGAASTAQQIDFPRQLQFGLAEPAAPPELTEARVDTVSGIAAARLEQAQTLAGAGEIAGALEIYRELVAEDTERVVRVDGDRFVSLRTYCHLQMARLPAEALALYRDRVDATAERLYREGIHKRDEALLRRVIDVMFCSSWGDDSLLAIGEIALERGDYAAARRAWEEISPLLRDPAGRPMWLALDGIDLDRHWDEVEERWNDRTAAPNWLAYPDTDIDLADVRARLVLVSIREVELDRAALELDVFRRFHPKATGRLGGQDGRYAVALDRLLAAARNWPELRPDTDWPTFAGSPRRNPTAAPVDVNAAIAWTKPIDLKPLAIARAAPPNDLWQRQFGRRVNVVNGNGGNHSQHGPSWFPISVDEVVLVAGASQMRALDVATGQPAITADGVIYHVEVAEPANAWAPVIGQGGITYGVPQFTMTVHDSIAYARVGDVVTSSHRPGRGPDSERLIGLDLKRDGLLTFQIKPDDETWSFDGAPLSDGRHVYVAMRRGDISPRAYVASFDAATGRRLWRTSIGAANTLAAGQVDEITHNLLTLTDERIYFNTNLGLVAALDAASGRIAWIHRYARAKSGPPAAGPSHFDRGPAPCLVADGIVFVAPADTPNVFALDASTGQLIWQSDELAGAVDLLGVVEGRLIITGQQLSIVDVRTGRTHFVWPVSRHAGIRGVGRGVLAGSEVFWPTRSAIYVYSALTGEQTRGPIPLGSIGNRGANLIAAKGFLIAAGPDRIMAYGPQQTRPDPTRHADGEPLAENEQRTSRD